jgi:hypothetical protein
MSNAKGVASVALTALLSCFVAAATLAAMLAYLAAAVTLAVLLTSFTAAKAQTAPATGQEPPAKAEEAKPACITDTSGFKMQGKTPVYEMTLQNTCAQRIKCKVYLNVETARGSTRGEATLVLEGRGQGEPPTKSYALKVKMLSGMAQGARECKVL